MDPFYIRCNYLGCCLAIWPTVTHLNAAQTVKTNIPNRYIPHNPKQKQARVVFEFFNTREWWWCLAQPWSAGQRAPEHMRAASYPEIAL